MEAQLEEYRVSDVYTIDTTPYYPALLLSTLEGGTARATYPLAIDY